MAAHRLKVTRSQEFETKARHFFPVGGSVDGKPSYELFADTVLKGIEFSFSRSFDDLPLAQPGLDAIRAVTTQSSPLFPPLVAFGLRVAEDTVELIDIEVDATFWDRL